MAKIFENGKWKKRTLTALSLSLAATLSLGLFSACSTPADDSEDSDSKVAPTDTQLIKNGNFEFYSDKLVDNDEHDKPLAKYNIISTPDSWSFTSGSPTSNTKSGVIDTKDWNYFTKTGGYPFKTFNKGEGDDSQEVTTFENIAEAYANWENENVSAYDRLQFLDLFKTEISALSASSDEAKMFKKYSYSVDFEDVKSFAEDFKSGFSLHTRATADEGNEDNTSVLMIHNQRTADDGVRGTAQYYTSGTTITLAAGTAAEVSVWVRTDALYHYKDTELTQRGGAYIGVTNTVGGSTLDQMQIYNIHTDGQWQQYTLYVRASTFATSTFRIVLGLGQGSSDDKYFAVDGYAFFDDVTCKLLAGEDYDKALRTDNGEGGLKEGVLECTVDSYKQDKQFNYDEYPYPTYKTYGLDLFAGFEADTELLNNTEKPALTEEKSGSNVYTSEKIDPSLGEGEKNFAEVTTFGAIKGNTANPYLKNVFENDLKDKFPFGDDNSPVVMLLSANGAAYTAKLSEITLHKNERILLSFFAKTSEIQSNLTGASATLVDGENKTTISSFDTTVLSTVDIDSKSEDESLKDIYKGWAQCFFFVENDTDADRTFHIELSYGPTTIVGTNKFSYGEGYAAFTNFEVKKLTKTEYGYASTGDRAKKVSLTGEVEETKKFDSVSATAEKDIEQKPALPANFRGVLGGSNYVQPNGDPNIKPDGVAAGLLNANYAKDYYKNTQDDWMNVLGGTRDVPTEDDALKTAAEDWWTSLFGSARQPLVIVNSEEAAYGYYAKSETVSASSYRRISMKVKASVGAKVNLYLIDTNAETTGTMLSPDLPKYTYWYDDEGNIVNMDPADDKFDKEGKVLYELQPNGLYTKVGETDGYLYANLDNYEKDEDGNLVTKDGTIAYYEYSNFYYAYRDDDNSPNESPFKTLVHPLPTDICRYTNTAKREETEAKMELTGTGEWVNVSFYLHTGNEAKTFRLEIWSGNRDGSVKNAAGTYVLFDNYSSADASSNFETIRNETVQAIKDQINEDKVLGGEGYIGSKDNLPEERALYYTFTFYDSPDYLRYDETTDEEGLGDPYYSYLQSSNSEQLVWLRYSEEAKNGQLANNAYFLDFSASDVTVEREYPPEDETDNDTTDADTDQDMNIWLLISSGSLAVVLLFAIAVVIVRRIVKKTGGKRTKVKAPKDKRYKPAKAPKAQEPETDEEE